VTIVPAERLWCDPHISYMLCIMLFTPAATTARTTLLLLSFIRGGASMLGPYILARRGSRQLICLALVSAVRLHAACSRIILCYS
jgi:hypothetical protein